MLCGTRELRLSGLIREDTGSGVGSTLRLSGT